MTFLLLTGCALIAFSPIISWYLLVILHKPYYLILSIGGGFFWLLPALLSSAIWYVFWYLTNIWVIVIMESLLFHEVFRWSFFYLLTLAANTKLMKTKVNTTTLGEEISIGSGIAVAHALIMYGSILWAAKGPGSYYVPSCPELPLFVSSAIICGMISLMDICWTVIAYEGYRTRSFPKIFFVVISHSASSLLTILNTLEGSGMCWFVFIGEALILFASIFVFFQSISAQSKRNEQKLR